MSPGCCWSLLSMEHPEESGKAVVCTNSLLVGTRAGLLSCRQVMQGGRYSGKGDAAWQAQPEAAAALLLVPLIRHALSAPWGHCAQKCTCCWPHCLAAGLLVTPLPTTAVKGKRRSPTTMDQSQTNTLAIANDHRQRPDLISDSGTPPSALSLRLEPLTYNTNKTLHLQGAESRHE